MSENSTATAITPPMAVRCPECNHLGMQAEVFASGETEEHPEAATKIEGETPRDLAVIGVIGSVESVLVCQNPACRARVNP